MISDNDIIVVTEESGRLGESGSTKGGGEIVDICGVVGGANVVVVISVSPS